MRTALRAAGVIALAAPSMAAATPAPGTIYYGQFDTIRSVVDDALPLTNPFSASTLTPGVQPAAAPDGVSVAWLRGPFGGPYEGVLVMRPGGTREAVRVTAAGAVQTLGPDGAVTGTVTDFAATGVADPMRLSGLGWRRDGAGLGFAVLLGPRRTLVEVVDVATGLPLTTGLIRQPRNLAARDIAWSADARLVAFDVPVTRRSDPGCAAGRSRVYVTSATGPGAPARRISLPGALCQGEDVDFTDPAFSPDGTQLIMTRRRHLPDGQVSDLVSVPLTADGAVAGPMREVSPGVSGVGQAVFSPDGHSIAATFMRPATGDGGIAVMAADGTGVHDVLVSPYLIVRDPDWAPGPPAG